MCTSKVASPNSRASQRRVIDGEVPVRGAEGRLQLDGIASAERHHVLQPECRGFAANRMYDRSSRCDAAWNSAAPQQENFCVRPQRRSGASPSGSFETFAAINSNVRCTSEPFTSKIAGGYLSSLCAVAAFDPRECVEVDFLFLLFSQIWPGFRYRLWPVDAPHYRVRAYTPAIYPTNNAIPIGPDQIGDRDALTFIIVHCLLTSCTVALLLQRDELRCLPAPHAALGGCWLKNALS